MKEHKSTGALVSLLSERGLQFRDPVAAVDVLRTINYYRFTGYSRYFQVDPRNGEDDYTGAPVFEDIVHLMRLDDEFRIRLFVALSEVEMAIRTRFAHVAGRIFGNGAFFLDPSRFISVTAETSKRIKRIRDDLLESKQATVAHYRTPGDVSGVPVWVAVEVLSFGKISWLIGSLDSQDLRTELAAFFAYEYSPFPRMLQSLADLRNICAHHGQLWHRNLVSQCPLPLDKRQRPLHLEYHAQSLYPAVMALHKLATSPSSRSQLAAIERRLAAGDLHSRGILNPDGVR